jgi:hypothetical protein
MTTDAFRSTARDAAPKPRRRTGGADRHGAD